MPSSIAKGFALLSTEADFERQMFATVTAMMAFKTKNLPDVYDSLIIGNGRKYRYQKSNESVPYDKTLPESELLKLKAIGKWRMLEDVDGGGNKPLTEEEMETVLASGEIGDIYQYGGATNDDYVHGGFYEIAQLEVTPAVTDLYSFKRGDTDSVFVSQSIPEIVALGEGGIISPIYEPTSTKESHVIRPNVEGYIVYDANDVLAIQVRSLGPDPIIYGTYYYNKDGNLVTPATTEKGWKALEVTGGATSSVHQPKTAAEMDECLKNAKDGEIDQYAGPTTTDGKYENGQFYKANVEEVKVAEQVTTTKTHGYDWHCVETTAVPQREIDVASAKSWDELKAIYDVSGLSPETCKLYDSITFNPLLTEDNTIYGNPLFTGKEHIKVTDPDDPTVVLLEYDDVVQNDYTMPSGDQMIINTRQIIKKVQIDSSTTPKTADFIDVNPDTTPPELYTTITDGEGNVRYVQTEDQSTMGQSMFEFSNSEPIDQTILVSPAKYEESKREWEQLASTLTQYKKADMDDAEKMIIGKIVQFVGTTDEDYEKMAMYECVEDTTQTPATKKWEKVSSTVEGNFVEQFTLADFADTTKMVEGKIVQCVEEGVPNNSAQAFHRSAMYECGYPPISNGTPVVKAYALDADVSGFYDDHLDGIYYSKFDISHYQEIEASRPLTSDDIKVYSEELVGYDPTDPTVEAYFACHEYPFKEHEVYVSRRTEGGSIVEKWYKDRVIVSNIHIETVAGETPSYKIKCTLTRRHKKTITVTREGVQYFDLQDVDPSSLTEDQYDWYDDPDTGTRRCVALEEIAPVPEAYAKCELEFSSTISDNNLVSIPKVASELSWIYIDDLKADIMSTGSENVGKTKIYVGETNDEFVNGISYTCVEDDSAYDPANIGDVATKIADSCVKVSENLYNIAAAKQNFEQFTLEFVPGTELMIAADIMKEYINIVKIYEHETAYATQTEWTKPESVGYGDVIFDIDGLKDIVMTDKNVVKLEFIGGAATIPTVNVIPTGTKTTLVPAVVWVNYGDVADPDEYFVIILVDSATIGSDALSVYYPMLEL